MWENLFNTSILDRFSQKNVFHGHRQEFRGIANRWMLQNALRNAVFTAAERFVKQASNKIPSHLYPIHIRSFSYLD